MRKLTLDEKISIKGIMYRYGVKMPNLKTYECLTFFQEWTGKSLKDWYKCNLNRRKGSKYA